MLRVHIHIFYLVGNLAQSNSIANVDRHINIDRRCIFLRQRLELSTSFQCYFVDAVPERTEKEIKPNGKFWLSGKGCVACSIPKKISHNVVIGLSSTDTTAHQTKEMVYILMSGGFKTITWFELTFSLIQASNMFISENAFQNSCKWSQVWTVHSETNRLSKSAATIQKI